MIRHDSKTLYLNVKGVKLEDREDLYGIARASMRWKFGGQTRFSIEGLCIPFEANLENRELKRLIMQDASFCGTYKDLVPNTPGRANINELLGSNLDSYTDYPFENTQTTGQKTLYQIPLTVFERKLLGSHQKILLSDLLLQLERDLSLSLGSLEKIEGNPESEESKSDFLSNLKGFPHEFKDMALRNGLYTAYRDSQKKSTKITQVKLMSSPMGGQPKRR